MSRIHEALRRAEQERAKGTAPEASPNPAELAKKSPAQPEPTKQVVAADTTTTTATVLSDPPTEESLTLESLRTRFRECKWKPDPKSMPFFRAENHTLGAEEFRTLRSRLYQMRNAQPLKSILVTSALPQEGKTFVSANLAQAFVRQAERRALLIDGDLRWSRLHLSLGAPAAPGLTDYLRGDADESAIIQRGTLGNLFFIPGGRSVSNPAELIGNGRLKILLERMATVFDWIILDSPPAIGVSDARMMGDLCDGVLVIVQAATTPFDLAQKVCQDFQNKRLLGAVLNRAEASSAYSSYYYSYYKKDAKNGKAKG